MMFSMCRGSFSEIEMSGDSDVFFTSHDPTQLNAQGNDVGEQYASVVFYHTLEQKEQAEQMIAGLKESKVYHPRTIVTQIRQASDFWKAE